jgi:hypothetical protein
MEPSCRRCESQLKPESLAFGVDVQVRLGGVARVSDPPDRLSRADLVTFPDSYASSLEVSEQNGFFASVDHDMVACRRTGTRPHRDLVVHTVDHLSEHASTWRDHNRAVGAVILWVGRKQPSCSPSIGAEADQIECSALGENSLVMVE